MAYRVFVSYAAQDRQFWKGLESYLSPLKRNALISAWNEEDILPGQNKEQQILEQIQQAQIILLLISQHFIASDICYSVEMKEAIERHNRGEARIIPILIRPGLYTDTPFATLTTLPRNKSISEYPKRDKAYAEIAEGISAVIKDLAKTETPPPPTSDTSPNPNNELLTGDFVGVAEAVGLPTKNIQDLNLIAASVKNWLRTHEGWLLILDNADDPERALAFVGKQLKGHVVLTSRNPGDGAGLQTLEIGEMKLDEGVDFLLLRANYTEDKDLSEVQLVSAREIVNMMGGLPLALVQAGAYIASMRCGLAGYIDRYKIRRATFLKDTRGLTAEHPEPVAATWLLSFDSVVKANPAAADLLCLCAFFYPDEIPEEMIRAGKQELSGPLQVIAEDDLLWDEAIYEMIKYSLVRRQEGKSLTVHRLVQDVLREGMDEERQKEWARASIGMVDLAFQEGNSFDEQNRKQYYVQHAQQCAIWIREMQFGSPEMVYFLLRVGRYLRERGQYKEAEPFLIQAHAVAEQEFGGESAEIADILNDTAELYRLQGRYGEALPLAQKGLELHEQVIQQPLKIADSSNTLARIDYNLASYKEAKTLYERALAIREQELGENHADVAESLNDLAVLYNSGLGDNKQAEILDKRALAIREKVYGTKHPDTALSLRNLAGVYKDQGRYSLAEPLFQQSRELLTRLLGPEHPNTIASLNNLASLYQAQGHYSLAEPLFQQSRELVTRLLGPEHPLTITCLNNIASLYYTQKRHPQAESLFKQVRSLRERILGPKHSDTATAIYHLACLYAEKRNYKQAEQLFPQALKILEETLGPEHPTTIKVLVSYASLLWVTSKARAAKMQNVLEERQRRAKEAQGASDEEEEKGE